MRASATNEGRELSKFTTDITEVKRPLRLNSNGGLVPRVRLINRPPSRRPRSMAHPRNDGTRGEFREAGDDVPNYSSRDANRARIDLARWPANKAAEREREKKVGWMVNAIATAGLAGDIRAAINLIEPSYSFFSGIECIP